MSGATPTIEEAGQRARAMAVLPERDRNVLIALGVMQRRVIDARGRFDGDFIPITLIETAVVRETVFDGVFYPGDCA